MSIPGSPPTIPIAAVRLPPEPFQPFPKLRFPGGVSGGPHVVLVVLLACAGALQVLTMTSGGTWPDPRIVHALLIVSVSGYALLWLLFILPSRRFARVMTDTAVHIRPELGWRSRIAEFDRSAVGLYRFCGMRLGARAARNTRIRISLSAAPTLVALVVLGWAGPAAYLTVDGVVPQVEAVSRTAGEGAMAGATELDLALRRGLGGLQAVADPPTGGVLGDPVQAATRALTTQPLFRSVSVIDKGGVAVASAGEPSRVPAAAPGTQAKVIQANESGSEPLVLASAPLPDGAGAIIGEFDPRALNDLIRADGARTRVVDARLGTVLDTAGFTAFEPLEDPNLAALVTGLSTNPNPAAAPAVGQPGGGQVAAAQKIGGSPETADLGWVLIQDRDATAAAFAGDQVRRTTLVVIVVSAVLAIAALVWSFVTVVLPARELARHLEGLAEGGEPLPLAPQRPDEIGTAVAANNRFIEERLAWAQAVTRS